MSCTRWRPLKWLVYYGDHLTTTALDGVELAIVGPDHVPPSVLNAPNVAFVAYLSVGEVEHYRTFYKTIKAWKPINGRPFIVEQNPIWKSYLVDIRDTRWQSLMLDQLIPSYIQKGFSGLLLDTVDTAIELEDRDPKKYKGSKDAMVSFVRSIRKKFPKLKIFPNNGLELLAIYGATIDGVMVEDLYTKYDFKKKKSFKTPTNEMSTKERYLDNFRKQFNKPVLNVLYETSPSTKLARFAIKRSDQKTYDWYLSTVDLNQFGTVHP